MSVTKSSRHKKRQLGQFLTPVSLSTSLIETNTFWRECRALEPSMGDGSFVLPLIEKFMKFYRGPVEKRLAEVLNKNVWGVELDPDLYQACLDKIKERWGFLPARHNLTRGDFFRQNIVVNGTSRPFDIIIGNPPFCGTFDPEIEDSLDSIYGIRGGEKIKKETYAFFIVKCMDILKKGGRLMFICSDTFLTINTMRGLRAHLMNHGDVFLKRISEFSEETKHPMVILDYAHQGGPGSLQVDNLSLSHESVRRTANLSFGLKPAFNKYFTGPRMGDYFVATSGMTTGKNEYFVREIKDNLIEEFYKFSFLERPIRLVEERNKARLGKLSDKTIFKIKQQEMFGETRRIINLKKLAVPKKVKLPDSRYKFYNKAVNSIIYSPPRFVIYWENNGEAVLTYKKSGNWYLRGVGGQPYFMREGITWQLIASRMRMRYLPSGYILDSGAPCVFPREHTPRDELFFALGWALTSQCNKILKEVINHTKNIQGKDFERLPYPFWVTPFNKELIISLVKS